MNLARVTPYQATRFDYYYRLITIEKIVLSSQHYEKYLGMMKSLDLLPMTSSDETRQRCPVSDGKRFP